jgi:5-formyltetrahydrofolate cyclo-ligase
LKKSDAMDKNAIRSEMRRMRSQFPLEQKRKLDSSICGKLYALLKDKKSVALYLALPNEIDLSQLVEKLLSSGVKVSSPKWNGEGYTLSRIRSLKAEDLSYGPMNVPESKYVDLVAFEEVDAYIVPGLAFSSSGCRIGYGGGWYDRMLQKASLKALKIGVCYSCQQLSSLPIETHDIAMDLVISE